jgi:hypothetical protein
MHLRGRVDGGCTRIDPKKQFRLGRDLILDKRSRLRLRQPPTHRAEPHLEAQLVAGDDLLPELGVIDAAQRTPRRWRRLVPLEQENTGHLEERFDQQHAGHDRQARKVTLEEFFVDGDVLDRDEPNARLVLHDRVDEEARIPVIDSFENGRQVDGQR